MRKGGKRKEKAIRFLRSIPSLSHRTQSPLTKMQQQQGRHTENCPPAKRTICHNTVQICPCMVIIKSRSTFNFIIVLNSLQTMHLTIACYYIAISASHQTHSLHKSLLNANRSEEERSSFPGCTCQNSMRL